MAEELLEKIPPEKRWAITAKILWRFTVLRGDKIFAPLLGVGKDIISPLWSKEKWMEINEKIWGDGGKMLFPWIKETFSIPVEDAIGAAKLVIVAAKLVQGPENNNKLVEATPEKAILRTTNCVAWDRYNEFEVDPVLRACDPACQVWCEEGLKAVNPKITFKFTKTRYWGAPYCEGVYEFTEE